ncbi:MAG TPA: hypothetical protein VIJ41_15810 [Candidatus Nanopelagicales bacterium]
MNRFVRHLLTATATAAVLVAPLAASTSASATPHQRTFSIVKDCQNFTGQPYPDSSCEITSSTLSLLPVGSTILYVQPSALATPAGSDIVIVTPGRHHRDKVFGNCSLDPNTFNGACTLDGGTGDFKRFHASVVVTNLDNRYFSWTGSYSFDSGHHDD